LISPKSSGDTIVFGPFGIDAWGAARGSGDQKKNPGAGDKVTMFFTSSMCFLLVSPSQLVYLEVFHIPRFPKCWICQGDDKNPVQQIQETWCLLILC
jgi:hypothetical protein